MLNKDGRYHWVIDAAVPRLAEDGRFLGFIGSVIDITERKLAEEALRTSEQLYRYWGVDPRRRVDLRSTGRSHVCQRIVSQAGGNDAAQCSQFGWGNALHPDDAERTIAAWRQCVRTGGSWDVEHRFRRADGTWHPMFLWVAYRSETSAVRSRRGPASIRHQPAEASRGRTATPTTAKTSFAELAHELRNAAPIRTGLELMRLAGDDHAAIEEVCAMMERQSQQMVRLIDDLLDVSRITRGTVELRKPCGAQRRD